MALLIIGLLALANSAFAAQLTLSWSSVTGAAGYKIYYGQATRNYTANVNAGNQTTYTVTGLTAGATYYFAATAYDSSGAQSGYSAEVTGVPPASTAPTASFSATATSGPAPLAVTFTDTSTGTISSRSWDLGNGSTATSATVSTNYSTPGTYNVVLTVTGSGGSSTATKTITATGTAPVAAFSATPTSGVAPVTVQFSDASQGTVSSWSWNFGDGTTSTLQNPSHSYTAPGTYTVSLSATGPGGTNQTSKTGYINVTAPSLGGGGTGGGGSTKVAGLVASYSFEETSGTTVVDSSGNGNNGLMNTGVSRIAKGRFGQALSFNGTDGWVTVNDSASLDPTSGVTLDAWIFPTAAMSGWQTVVMKEQPGGIVYYLEANSDTSQPASGVSVGGEQILRGVNPVPLNQWTRLTATYDGQYQRLYVNGAQVSVRAQTGALATSTGALRIGGDSVWGEFFAGYIDEVRVYNRALTQAEITGTTSSNPGLVAAYGFEESSGTSVIDSSGSGNTGVISGANRTTTGRFGKALQFNGTNSWVTVNDSASLDLTTGMTLEAWVYPTARLTGWQGLLIKEIGTTDAAYMLYANDANNRPQVSANIGGYSAAPGTAQLGTNVWTHVAGTYDGANFRLYINGSLAATQPQAGPIPVSNGALRIGGDAVWGEYFAGYIDEVRIYNQALTQAQIAADANTPVVP